MTVLKYEGGGGGMKIGKVANSAKKKKNDQGLTRMKGGEDRKGEGKRGEENTTRDITWNIGGERKAR